MVATSDDLTVAGFGSGDAATEDAGSTMAGVGARTPAAAFGQNAQTGLAGIVLGALGAAAGGLWIGMLLIASVVLARFGRPRQAVADPTDRGVANGQTFAEAGPVKASVRPALRIAVGIATVGRPTIACETIAALARQTRRPDRVVVSVPTGADCPWEPEESETASSITNVTIIVGTRGLTAQRNAILKALFDADIVCFFDDDFVPHEDYLAAVESAFRADPGLVGATGFVVADGITGPGYTASEAAVMLRSLGDDRLMTPVPAYSAYGCNMAFRLNVIRWQRIAFDEQLPAYGWLEDTDFSRRMARHGRLARLNAAAGVHLGVKGGRVSGLRFGYSQIANPIYLVRKGSYSPVRAAWLMSRNVAMNLLHAYRPEPNIDRRGRVAGNFQAFADLVRGRLHPTRITALT